MIGFQQPRSILTVAVHKGASSFLADDFATAVSQALPKLKVVRYGSKILKGYRPSDLVVPAKSGFFVRVYPSDIPDLVVAESGSDKLSDLSLLFLHRDPRDAAVSLYYSTAFSHSLAVPDADRFLQFRDRLQGTSVTEGVKLCTKPAINEFLAMIELGQRYPGAMVSSYEEMVGDYQSWLARFSAHVGWSKRTLKKVAEVTGDPFIPPSDVDASQHRRRVTPGNWREVFDDELRETFEEACGAEMKAAGYTW